jgi:hypothetical protein
MLRCSLVKLAHGTKGHQLKDGHYFAYGDYVSSFSVDSHRSSILNRVYFRLHRLLERLSNYNRARLDENQGAAIIHRNEVLRPFIVEAEEQGLTIFKRSRFCVSCLFKTAAHTMPCGHSFCKECSRAYGIHRSRTIVELHECSLHSRSYVLPQRQTIYIKPEMAGIRILSLDEYVYIRSCACFSSNYVISGGVQSIVQVEILKMIEKHFRKKIPLQHFFDLIVGEG